VAEILVQKEDHCEQWVYCAVFIEYECSVRNITPDNAGERCEGLTRFPPLEVGSELHQAGESSEHMIIIHQH
jgi:hypothetical protein